MDYTVAPLPRIVKVLAWLWIAGALWKLTTLYLSWPAFESWRNEFLVIMKLAMLLSGILLLRRLKQGPVVYFSVTVVSYLVFYLNTPSLVDIERYFNPGAIGLAMIIQVIFLLIVGYHWKYLKWR